MRDPDDRVCSACGAILRWYKGINWANYFHVKVNGTFYVTGHKPDPAPALVTKEDTPK